MKKESQIINIFISIAYIGSFITLFLFCLNKFENNEERSFQVWLTSGILYLILGKYFLTKYFTKPLDAFSNTLGIIIALLFDSNKFGLWWYILIYMILSFIISTIVISTSKHKYKGQNFLYKLSTKLGNSNIVFSIVFLVYSYVYIAKANMFLEFIMSILIWGDLVYLNAVEKLFYYFYHLKKNKKLFLPAIFCGVIEKKLGDSLYTFISIENSNYSNYYAIKLKNKKFGIAYLLSEILDIYDKKKLLYLTSLEYNSKELNIPNYNYSISENTNEVFNLELESLNIKIKEQIISCCICYQNSIGYIIENSDINSIIFLLFNKNQNDLFEGKIVTTYINKKRVLYQIINAKTKKDDYGNLHVYGQKIGHYDINTKKINTVKWLPKLYDLLYAVENTNITELDYNNSIGRLPESNFQILLSNINELITYNVAILGILGIGKSCLAFELITKILQENIKIICIDITNQYASNEGLYKYIDKNKIILDDRSENININSDKTGHNNRPSEWGNLGDYKQSCKDDINDFLNNSEKTIKVFNPNRYIIKKAATQFNITENIEISLVEKTRYFCEAILEQLNKKLTNKAKCMIVFEEAHSLIPEFNSVSIRGDEAHSNAIAKVILQGRKYGLGSMLITQRTANISKSALCQCNTIFALRSYDDTSKQFLDNYIGSSYSTLIPNLEERTAIATGKGIDCKCPVIIELNDKKHFEKYA